MKITEEWLKEHGWKIRNYDIVLFNERFNYATKMFGRNKVIWNNKHQLTIFRDYVEDSGVYADVLIDNVDTVERLQEALVFCRVAVKDSLTIAEKQVWHKASEELPKDGTHILYIKKTLYGLYYGIIYYPEPPITDEMDWWMEIPELPKED